SSNERSKSFSCQEPVPMERDRVFGQDDAQSKYGSGFKLLERPLARPGRRAAHFRRQDAQNEKGQAPPDLP
ncbi:hypothetical protein, partial [Mesorhizobium sp. M7D.F.Ca.US.004.01.2.1]|uniref:hypothetical protein n=1 Tax=Mesorhizobium sp. M7D.F.Ca.US.004.01.2.1 TaxID=2496738 RepID=UPI0019D26C51